MRETGENPLFAAYYRSPFGLISILSDSEAIRALSFGYLPGDEQEKPVLHDAIIQLQEYFAGKRKVFTLPLRTKGTPFQESVWYQLQQIPYGETRSYADIAFEIDNPKAFRAVGMANNRNPIGIIIPCHRVIGKNGALVGYAGGLQYKQKLLELERLYR
ncbi:O-6-methylguanine DNA methyltransferase [Sphaerochaeta pleomorpha str. Grapes]|uniref:Methylated-DNA--protein-cysteine methyltransferase n=1 Tax=Sphaerochaeta pleomorpha (strain ATCC BAA-1885 / DSM 22778 / Grapes) TaxID=158190 RepID=G8QVH3_SPHPG|nr:methylated-DNA--[protein]-cysteine S-methyltransferase [Sphaerochaeta pleomorpha]AEV28206.1 O-6-methylguanine DNA methyltransferase [Sphaerochaeta pleomorpha str. Grapes]